MLFHVVEQMTGPSAFDFVVPVDPSRCSSTCTMQHNQDLLWLLSSASLAILFATSSLPSALIGAGNFVILVLDVINLPLCSCLLRTSSGTSFNPFVLRLCVTAPPPVEEHTFVELTIDPLVRSYCVESPNLTQRVPFALVKPHLDVRTCECLQCR